MKTLITKAERAVLTTTFEEGTRLTFVREGYEPQVMVSPGDCAEDEITLSLALTHGEGHGDFECFTSENKLPLVAVMKSCIFDLQGFCEESNPEEGMGGILCGGISHALNALGSLSFYSEEGKLLARFEFGNFYIYFPLEKKDVNRYFKRD